MVCRRLTMLVALLPNMRRQALYALRVLRAHGLCDLALQAIFRSVVVAKLLYASSAWWGFTNVSDRQRVDAFLRRSMRCGYCTLNLLQFVEQCKAADDQLFNKILVDTNHVLFTLLQPRAVALQNYYLRPSPP